MHHLKHPCSTFSHLSSRKWASPSSSRVTRKFCDQRAAFQRWLRRCYSGWRSSRDCPWKKNHPFGVTRVANPHMISYDICWWCCLLDSEAWKRRSASLKIDKLVFLTKKRKSIVPWNIWCGAWVFPGMARSISMRCIPHFETKLADDYNPIFVGDNLRSGDKYLQPAMGTVCLKSFFWGPGFFQEATPGPKFIEYPLAHGHRFHLNSGLRVASANNHTLLAQTLINHRFSTLNTSTH